MENSGYMKIPVNRGISSRNSCDDKSTSAVAVPHMYFNFVPETITEEIHREASKTTQQDRQNNCWSRWLCSTRKAE